MTRQLIFVLGGARSGKSFYAEQWARAHGQQVLFVATAEALDGDMRDRIQRHRDQRPAHWQTLEAPLDTARAIANQLMQHDYDLIVLDCLTLLASNLLLTLPEDCSQDQANTAILTEVDALLDTYARFETSWLVISNEVGMGVVPPSRLGRVYRDALGRANQRIAQAADDVQLLVAGLPWSLKAAR
ncbi:MAG: bifunctional adenosylcobinamide kinase/adenosylcobinamide-phosphate guanylyltransferase [Anaerolineae bacterium]|nr:bifunctional adenosylcobinamide kinase/adenosylcobinamide-phosphate guanylyltransferase [Anaerolineae bacterium]